jgi:hypothetical protein
MHDDSNNSTTSNRPCRAGDVGGTSLSGADTNQQCRCQTCVWSGRVFRALQTWNSPLAQPVVQSSWVWATRKAREGGGPPPVASPCLGPACWCVPCRAVLRCWAFSAPAPLFFCSGIMSAYYITLMLRCLLLHRQSKTGSEGKGARGREKREYVLRSISTWLPMQLFFTNCSCVQSKAGCIQI